MRQINGNGEQGLWCTTVQQVGQHRIRGLAPAPGAWCEADLGQGAVRLKLLFSERTNLWNPTAPGTLLDDQLAVACGDGRAMRLLKLQKPGGKPLEARDFLAGTSLAAGTILT